MIDFEKEIKKFEKATQIENIQDLIADYDISDMNDLIFNMIKKQGEK